MELRIIPVDGKPSYIVLTPDDKRAYVVDYLNSRVFVILTSNNTLAKTLELRGHKLQDAVVSPDGSMVYVANQDQNFHALDIVLSSVLSKITGALGCIFCRMVVVCNLSVRRMGTGDHVHTPDGITWCIRSLPGQNYEML